MKTRFYSKAYGENVFIKYDIFYYTFKVKRILNFVSCTKCTQNRRIIFLTLNFKNNSSQSILGFVFSFSLKTKRRF